MQLASGHRSRHRRLLTEEIWQAQGSDAVREPVVSGSEDFSEVQKVAPGFCYFLGVPPAGQDFAKAPSNHSPLFDIDEKQLLTGARSLAALAVDYLQRSSR